MQRVIAPCVGYVDFLLCQQGGNGTFVVVIKVGIKPVMKRKVIPVFVGAGIGTFLIQHIVIDIFPKISGGRPSDIFGDRAVKNGRAASSGQRKDRRSCGEEVLFNPVTLRVLTVIEIIPDIIVPRIQVI
ncbi:MAG: hypothetical protein IJ603_06430 [Bacteroidales bacterium]|nr:hypothetical protein [Bacteroidales bacterium]MBR1578467.1 hypothetical protein [Bacteroidales bacterium]